MDQLFLLAYYVLPVTSVLLFSFPSEFPVQLHVTFLLLAIPFSRMFPSTSYQSLGPLFGFCPFLQLTKPFVLSVLWFLFVCLLPIPISCWPKSLSVVALGCL